MPVLGAGERVLERRLDRPGQPRLVRVIRVAHARKRYLPPASFSPNRNQRRGFEEVSMSQKSSHLPDQPIMKYVHPADRLRPWFGAAVGLATLAGMLAFGVLGRDFGTLAHPKALNAAGGGPPMSPTA